MGAVMLSIAMSTPTLLILFSKYLLKNLGGKFLGEIAGSKVGAEKVDDPRKFFLLMSENKELLKE